MTSPNFAADVDMRDLGARRYAVHVEVEVDSLSPELDLPEALAALAEAVGEDAAASHRLTRPGYGIDVVVDAADAPTAGRAVVELVQARARDVSLPDGDVVVLEVLPEAERDARLDDSGLADLVGSGEAAELLDVSRQRVHQLASGHADFPEPVVRLSGSPIWLASQINAFVRRWDRTPGRRPKQRRMYAFVDRRFSDLVGGETSGSPTDTATK